MGELTGREIYDNFHDGRGPERLSESAAMVRQASGDCADIAKEIHGLALAMEDMWQGDAADGGQRGARPMLIEHEKASHELGTAQDLTDRQAGSFTEARNRVVPVPPEPTEVTPWQLAANDGLMVTYLQARHAHNTAAQNNVDVMTGYSGASAYNTDGLPTSYGSLVDDESGVAIGQPDTIDSESFDDGRRGGGEPGNREPGSGPPGSSSPWPGTGDPGGARPPVPGDAGATTPESFTPMPAGTASGGPPGNLDPGQTPGRGPGGSPVPLSSVPFGGTESGRGSSTGRGGSPGAGAGGAGQRGVAPGGSAPRGGAAEPAGARPGSVGGGRGGTGLGGVPMGGGRGRDEDNERRTPAYLEGGDPDDLFDTDQLTAPSSIGAEDDE